MAIATTGRAVGGSGRGFSSTHAPRARRRSERTNASCLAMLRFNVMLSGRAQIMAVSLNRYVSGRRRCPRRPSASLTTFYPVAARFRIIPLGLPRGVALSLNRARGSHIGGRVRSHLVAPEARERRQAPTLAIERGNRRAMGNSEPGHVRDPATPLGSLRTDSDGLSWFCAVRLRPFTNSGRRCC